MHTQKKPICFQISAHFSTLTPQLCVSRDFSSRLTRSGGNSTPVVPGAGALSGTSGSIPQGPKICHSYSTYRYVEHIPPKKIKTNRKHWDFSKGIKSSETRGFHQREGMASQRLDQIMILRR